MIGNATIYPSQVTLPGLSIVKKPVRLRDHIDKKRNYLLVKRMTDILFASFFILFILSWLIPVIILLIKNGFPRAGFLSPEKSRPWWEVI